MDYLRVGKNRVPVTIDRDPQGIGLKFGFNEVIKDEVKIMEGARWNPATKGWVVKPGQRNEFALSYLLGYDPYSPWDNDLPSFLPNRGRKDIDPDGVVYEHQCGMASHQFYRPGSISAAEMGTGKTLTAIEVLEMMLAQWGDFSAWYTAPKVALMSVKMDFRKWKAKKTPNFFTLHEFTAQIKALDPNKNIPPRVLYIDEASKVKNPAAKVSQAAKWLADWMREYWQGKQRVILMSGSPAPKSPLDWWMLCEIAQPGFLREGTPAKFMDRIALVKKVAGETGVAYPKIITFKDNTKKCAVCGRLDDHEIHKGDIKTQMTYVGGSEVENQIHPFKESENEVAKMYGRMDGLVKVYLKKDCMQLPEKVYRVVKCKPTKYMRSLAKMVAKTAPGAAQAILLLRELSDGFQYEDRLVGTRECTHCCGPDGKPTGRQALIHPDTNEPIPGSENEQACIHCAGKRVFKEYKTETVEVDTPKIQATLDILEEKEEDGRLVIFGAFTGTLDRICATVVKAGWHFIRRDGRGWYSSMGTYSPEDMIAMFQREKACEHERICLVGHPKSCGMGLTLTASDTELYYSNSFDAEDRIQSEDRIHRHGCRGANIIDLEHLPVDKLVRENLKAKRDLQSLTMGEVEAAMNLEDDDAEY